MLEGSHKAAFLATKFTTETPVHLEVDHGHFCYSEYL